MEVSEYLEKRLYVYRKSYKFYDNIGIGLSVSKILFTTSGLSALALPPLVCLPLGAALIEFFDKKYKTSERIKEYKLIYKFYRQLLHLYKAGKINEKEINLR